MIYVFPLCVLLVFLVLAAQCESWTLPLAVILIVPRSILCALIGVKLTHGDNNVRRHAERDLLRPVPDAGVLRLAAHLGTAL
ncbi:hypothetical protein L1274_004376 [Duganella sp. HSC-15S17]|uniref:Secreted protein n=1 Tax=Duganella violaceipulchra TaxID=2849652 RepID=A0ABT1GNR3_9BURK|nr:efflux RND transporter permease subunit [Duganella violaceicalia]MCP2010634.1 hypothetical protein [Duganella violaceicalia]